MIQSVWEKLIDSLSPVQVCWMCLLVTGGLALFSVRTFADNNKVEAVQKDVSSLKAEFLEQRIFETRLRQCTAESTEARQFYGEKVSELLVRYRNSTGTSYQLPNCDEVR